MTEPMDYPVVKLGDIATINDENYRGGWSEIKYLDTSSITRNRISGFQELVPGKDKIPSSAKRVVRPGDIIYAIRGSRHYEHHGLIGNDWPENALVSTAFATLRTKPDMAHSDYVYWYLTQDWIAKHLYGLAVESSTAIPSISLDVLENFEIPLPPLEEQKRQARLLNTLDSIFDNMDEMSNAIDEMSSILENMARLLFKAWFVDFEPVKAKIDGRWKQGESLPGMPAELWDVFPDKLVGSELGKIPEGWEVKTIGDVTSLFNGKRPPEIQPHKDEKFSIPVWGANGITNWTTKPFLDHSIILTGRVGTLGSVFRITESCWPSDNSIVLTPKQDNMYDYLFYWIKSNVDFESLNRGTSQLLLGQNDLKLQLVVQPHDTTISEFQKLLNVFFDGYDISKESSMEYTRQRDKLLSKII